VLDVTELVLEDHETLRRRFAALDDAADEEALTVLWNDLANLLEVHADCEEAVFYPALLGERTEDGRDETEDAIDDHNKIRDAVRETANHQVGSPEWWKAVGQARTENSKHIAEEEREALPDFRRHASTEQRQGLAVQWTSWRMGHQPPRGIDTSDRDVETYLDENS
jgi:hypothetical protein